MQHTARHGRLQIAVGKDDIGRLAAQLLRDALHRICGIFGNLDTGPRRSRERDHVHLRVASQRIADGCAGAVDHIKHAFGEACLIDHFSEQLSR